ncbi:MAG: glycosyl transferase [Alphaproteobacteria bacterium HGW-Alphaproteobacteria-2]|nr:MAG: glycosyl transferase [Alphaproteobacteria bacterium HGW-Alphaproteobacteria-2]
MKTGRAQTLHPDRAAQSALSRDDRRLGDRLCAAGLIDRSTLAAALALRRRGTARLGEVLVARGWLEPEALAELLAAQAGLPLVRLAKAPPDPALAGLLAVEEALRLRAVPWRSDGNDMPRIALADPARRVALARLLALRGQHADIVLAPAEEVAAAQTELYRAALCARAETRCPAELSVRGLPSAWLGRAAAMAGLAVAALALAAPRLAFGLLVGLAIAALCVSTLMRLAGIAGRLVGLGHAAVPAALPPRAARLPVVSLMVPLYREARILPALIDRLAQLDYPPELLDICLVVEEVDGETRDALAGRPLPPWMRVIVVPDAKLRTKPRALNFALDFCRGALIGVYDAEDEPEPTQIRKVIARFFARGPELGCVQGVLDTYNPQASWLTRCFTLEYAAWFRLVLPGLERLGLPVPLGGTTMFVRRDVLEHLGGWDAHNVTEDADLGMRIARAGWRTEFVPTVTREEAAAGHWAWVRQRSRWLKGFTMTWASHMRAPRKLRADLGWRGFLTFQALFLASVGGFALAPVLWTFWSAALFGVLPLAAPGLGLVAGVFLAAEITVMLAVLAAASGPAHRGLLPWLFTLPFYFALATPAAWKALWELARRPFFWDKTEHGARAEPPAASDLAPRRSRVET